MRLTRPRTRPLGRAVAVTTSALALTTMAAAGVSLGTAGAPERSDAAVVSGDRVALAALPALSFPTGVYMENRVSDHVSIPPGTVIVFQGLPPGLSYDPATTAIRGVPTTPGVYRPTATAYVAGIPVRTESTTVTITGAPVAPAPGNPSPAPGDPAPAPAPAPAPGTIDIEMIRSLALPQPVKDAVLNTALAINDGIRAAWNAVPAGSLGK